MQKIQKQQKDNLIYSQHIIHNIAPFLTLSQLLNTATLSKQWNYLLQNYIDHALIPHNYQQNHQNHQNHQNNPLKTLKYFYNRKLFIYNDDKNQKQNQSISFPYLITSVSLGTHISILALFNQKHKIVVNSKLLNNIIQEIPFEFNFSILICSGDYIYGVLNSTLTRINVHKNQSQIFQLKVQNLIQFKQKIIDIKVSPSHILVFTFQNQHNSNNLYLINHLTFKETLLKPIEPYNPQHFALGNKQCYQVNNYTVYTFNLNKPQQPPQLMKSFKGKNIVKIYNGSGHYIACQRNRKILRDWNNKQVIQWLNQQGFDDFIKICKNQKITGQKLLTMDKSYMQDVLGVTSAKVQSKMLLRIQANNKQQAQNYSYYVWGRNDKGQLSHQNKNSINNPTKFKPIPDDFTVWHAQGHYTFLKNLKGQIIINKQKEDNSGNFCWQILSKNKIWSISVLKRNLIYLGSPFENKGPQALNQNPIHLKKDKLRTAKNIIDQIQWDQKLNKQEFRVGYLDKFSGQLECSFEQLLVSEVKDYRIMYFKKGNEIVWDKAKRIDKL